MGDPDNMQQWITAGCRWGDNVENRTPGEFGCPVCNGLTQITRSCSVCGKTMEDKGPLEDYLGPYSPNGYLDCRDALGQSVSSGPCIHLVYCSNCDLDARIQVHLELLV